MTAHGNDGPKDWYGEDMATFGDRLTGAREALALDTAELAHRLGVRTETLASWENDRSEPRANRLSMLAGLLNVSLRWLLTGEGEGPVPDRSGNDATTLAEMRQVQAEMVRLAERLGRLEKRLREGEEA